MKKIQISTLAFILFLLIGCNRAQEADCRKAFDNIYALYDLPKNDKTYEDDVRGCRGYDLKVVTCFANAKSTQELMDKCGFKPEQPAKEADAKPPAAPAESKPATGEKPAGETATPAENKPATGEKPAGETATPAESKPATGEKPAGETATPADKPPTSPATKTPPTNKAKTGNSKADNTEAKRPPAGPAKPKTTTSATAKPKTASQD